VLNVQWDGAEFDILLAPVVNHKIFEAVSGDKDQSHDRDFRSFRSAIPNVASLWNQEPTVYYDLFQLEKLGEILISARKQLSEHKTEFMQLDMQDMDFEKLVSSTMTPYSVKMARGLEDFKIRAIVFFKWWQRFVDAKPYLHGITWEIFVNHATRDGTQATTYAVLQCVWNTLIDISKSLKTGTIKDHPIMVIHNMLAPFTTPSDFSKLKDRAKADHTPVLISDGVTMDLIEADYSRDDWIRLAPYAREWTTLSQEEIVSSVTTCGVDNMALHSQDVEEKLDPEASPAPYCVVL